MFQFFSKSYTFIIKIYLLPCFIDNLYSKKFVRVVLVSIHPHALLGIIPTIIEGVDRYVYP